ncbi:hypothetical protein [Paracidovorax valerianellae]|uniref:Uncharacterized protein n=1 Tax=Paracidovorax valerianellae TaxID=187868 RepID=A0A1G6WND7_9BURK|nr:hypothetical protein [Paracidovorax valerianellae]MDA8447600.1 hypothetical protein [Paracidovorax valerianellae]SDD67173.1 hypothetical protein SAMN05192589_10860 [Paracidovorax valerianellae]
MSGSPIMNKLFRIAIHAGSIFGLLVMALLPGDKYGFMQEMDPSIPANAIENGTGNSTVAASAIFALVAIAQIAIAVKSSKPSGRVLPAVLILLGLALLALKILG